MQCTASVNVPPTRLATYMTVPMDFANTTGLPAKLSLFGVWGHTQAVLWQVLVESQMAEQKLRLVAQAL